MQQLTEKCKQMQTELETFVQLKEESQQLSDNHIILQKEHDDLRLLFIYGIIYFILIADVFVYNVLISAFY